MESELPDGVTVAEKRCAGCDQTKPWHEFNRDRRRKSGLAAPCRQCAILRRRLSEQKLKSADPEEWQRRQRGYKATYRGRHPERVALSYRAQGLKEKYGITIDQYDAMLAHQGGGCAICKTEPAVNRRLAVDHCHDTNNVRGLLCDLCNNAIGMLRDEPERIAAALVYVTHFQRKHKEDQ